MFSVLLADESQAIVCYFRFLDRDQPVIPVWLDEIHHQLSIAEGKKAEGRGQKERPFKAKVPAVKDVLTALAVAIKSKYYHRG